MDINSGRIRIDSGGISELMQEHFAVYHIRSTKTYVFCTVMFCKLSCNEAFLVLARRKRR
jgi:hypothetical protein